MCGLRTKFKDSMSTPPGRKLEEKRKHTVNSDQFVCFVALSHKGSTQPLLGPLKL